MKHIASLGGISFDLYFAGKNLTIVNNRFNLAIGGKYPADTFYQHAGGGAVNVGIAMELAGHKVSLIGVIGDTEFRPIIEERLRSAHIHHDLCLVMKDYFNVSAIILTGNGERTILNYEMPGQQLFFTDAHIDAVSQMDALYLGNLPDVPLQERRNFVAAIKAKNPHVQVFVNMGVADCKKPILETFPLVEVCDGIIINAHEMCELVKKEYDLTLFNETFIQSIPTLSQKLVVVTDGEKGSYAWHEGAFYAQDIVHVDTIVDTTGAGDGFTGAFIAHFLETQNIAESLKKGAERSAVVIAMIGAT